MKEIKFVLFIFAMVFVSCQTKTKVMLKMNLIWTKLFVVHLTVNSTLSKIL